jgi:LmbE family N-acetylglucosaminyl deacetylase
MKKKRAKAGWRRYLRASYWRKVVRKRKFAKAYARASVAILLATTLFWAILSAKIQQGNADQLVNPYLFDHANTFHGALFPGQHTFLIKWPIFFLIKLFGFSGNAFLAFTIGIVIVTVALFAMILYRIERRPLYFGTLCLALSSVLLLVPTMVYPGGLLPVNMAMITTRNLEYILYIVSLIIIARLPRFKSWGFWLAVGSMTLLITSDKLFLTLSIGGALLTLIVYALFKQWALVRLSYKWLAANILATIGAISALWLINVSHITNIFAQSGIGPYGLAPSARAIARGGVYALLGMFTNFGANPAFDVSVVKKLPHQIYGRLISAGGVTFVINAVILAACIFIIYRLVVSSMMARKNKKSLLDVPFNLSIMLIWATAAAFCAYIFSDHYYPSDDRYLTIVLFTGFIGAATFVSRKKWRPEKIVLIGVIIMIGIMIGLAVPLRTYREDKSALATINDRNTLVAQVLVGHPVNTLVGDYWRVMPTKLIAGKPLHVMPLIGCLQAQTILSSKAWQLDLNKHSFAYLLSFDQSSARYPNCTLKQVINRYGRPNASTLIAGSLSQPKEVLLFYDHGARNSAPKITLSEASTVLPIPLGILPNTSCPTSTVVGVVAHQDDDLLFMNPDLINDIRAGNCVRTIYVTAGDAGSNKFYWGSREQGSEAAYAYMLMDPNNIWIHRIVKLPNNSFVTVANPRGNTKISLIFMHLPDGNLRGQGFKTSLYESLAKLETGKIHVINSVDNQSSYTSAQLVTALTSLIYTYQPTEIRTQANYVSSQFPDHSDHMAVGRYVQRAYKQYGNQVITPIKFYIGYPVRGLPENEFRTDHQDKLGAFLAYAKFDPSVCHSEQECNQAPAYNAYLKREYQNAY